MKNIQKIITDLLFFLIIKPGPWAKPQKKSPAGAILPIAKGSFAISLILIIMPLSCTNGVNDMIGSLGREVPICVKSDAPAGGDGRGWSTAYNSITAAVAAADAGAEIWVAGTFEISGTPTINKKVYLYGGFSGTESDRDERNLNNKTVIQGAGHIILSVDGILMDGFKFTGSRSSEGLGLAPSNSYILRNCEFDTNTNTSYGGGALYCNNIVKLEIINCIFTGNKTNSSGSFGGAIWCNSSSLIITGCSFNSNESTSGRGGAIYCENSNNIDITDTTFINNKATGNYYGGAIFAQGGVLTIDKCIFQSNKGALGGGAIRSSTGNSLRITSTLFESNSVNDEQMGGAILSDASTLVVINSVFNSNHTGQTIGSHGGAIYIYGALDDIIVNSTFFNNNVITSFYGAIYNLGSTDLYIYNCIFSQNKGTAVGGSGATIMRNNAWDDGSTCTGSVTLSQSPFVSTTSGNEDFRLVSGSNCIDAGLNISSGEIPGFTMPSTDLAGNPRIAGGTIDIGAYEMQ